MGRTKRKMTLRKLSLGAVSLVALAAGCVAPKNRATPGGVTADAHAWFPITAGARHAIGQTTMDGAVACASCHATTAASFKDFSCVSCHDHEQVLTDRLHTSVKDYAFTNQKCLSCHPAGERVDYDHAGVTNNCAMCHDVAKPFAALPIPGFTHPQTGGADCASCHGTSDWKGATGGPPGDAHDPGNDLRVDALIPTYAGMTMSSLSPRTETLPMPMNHGSMDVPGPILAACTNCHQDAATGVYFPALFHSSLANMAITDPTVVEPKSCVTCHASSMPVGFVGPTATSPARSPASGEMKHDAVAWAGDAPTTNRIVTMECGTCHVSPGRHLDATWSSGPGGGSPAQYHPALAAASMSQPTSCVDCHANSRPTAALTSMNASVPAGLTFDHGVASAQGDCASCHTATAASNWTSWSGARFHQAGGAAPPTCLPCHASERPTSTSGWLSTTYKTSPFDYTGGTNSTTHGDGQDCAGCHTGPGTGAWGANPNWAGGQFPHGPSTVAATTCIACHSSQRPDLQPGTTAAAAATLIGFDHAQDGTGECFGCHQATVTAGTYVNYANPTTHTLPNGDWKGGQTYPGSSFASSADQSIMVKETTLIRSGPSNLVTSTSSVTATLYNGMLHVSKVLPAALAAGPSTSPDNTKCWHCHTSSNGVVTAYRNGQYHKALTSFTATPGGAVAPIAQPTSNCADCHAPMMPTGIVQKAGSSLQAMDHGAAFASTVMIGGAAVNKVADLDCSTCHRSPGATWSDGAFHANIGAATPKDCVACHYVLMADTAKADVTSGVAFAMKHASPELTFQSCQTCHPAAFAKGATMPIAATLWQTGALHAGLPKQPATCLGCHTVSQPAATAPTQSTVAYTLTLGGTSSNGAQWMNHGSGQVAGKDCAACHAADAKPTGSAWSKSVSFHAAVASVKTCQECHGVTNGGGAVPGTKNNLPAALTNASMATTAATGTATGIPAGTLAQISHTDVNVSGHDCGFCHTQAGASTAAGVQGKEWAQARFHANFTAAASPLVMNATTGRCSNCHMGEKPGAAFSAQDHGAFTNASGSEDCSSCHSFPGTGTASAPNWLGAAGMPISIPVGGFAIPQPPATGASTQTGINNLPHPTVATGVACTSCHKTAAGGKNAIGYDHKSSLINAACSACHEAGSNLVGTPWNGATSQGSGAGDTRPFTIVGLVPSNGGNHTMKDSFNHFFAHDCGQCHVAPSGNGLTATGGGYKSAWRFNHNESKMKNPSVCNMCHGSPNNIPGD